MWTYRRILRIPKKARICSSSFHDKPKRTTDETIYTTKIDEFVCPPNISETVAVRIMKHAHRPRIASTTIKLVSKPILLSILSILLKTIQRIGTGPAARSANRRRHLFVYGDSANCIGFRFVDNLVPPSGRSICNNILQ